MDNHSATVRQSFGATVLASGAVANQGHFQQCTFLPSLTPEILAQLQQLLSAQTDATNPDRIFRSVAQLGFLNKHERVTLAGPDARSALDNIGNVLQALSPPTASPHTLDREAAHGHDTHHGGSSGRHDAVEVVRRILCASEYVDVNQTHAIRRQVSRASTSTVLSKINEKFDIAHAQVRVYAWKRKLLSSRVENSTHDEFTVRIDIQPKLEGAPDGNPYISIYFQQIQGFRQSSFLYPVIVARRTIPYYSPVFLMIVTGDFEGFVRLLRCGKASLWDCDPHGTSLITYAASSLRLEICKYLIENGADVDCTESVACDKGSYGPSPIMEHVLLACLHLDYTTHIAFIKYLLEAGADPTLGNDRSPLSVCTMFFGWQHAALLLQFSREYVDTKVRSSWGDTMLLRLCHTISYRTKFEYNTLDYLIMLGSTLDERDPDGDTCLHITLSTSGSKESIWNKKNLFMFTYHLLDLGADANALNDLNETPSDVVFNRNHMVLCKTWDLTLYVKGIKVDDWEAKKQKIHERDGVDFRIPPLSERGALIVEHDWLERVWSEAAEWIYAGQKKPEWDVSEEEESEEEESEEEESEEEEAEEMELADARTCNKRKRLASDRTSGFQAQILGPLDQISKIRRLE